MVGPYVVMQHRRAYQENNTEWEIQMRESLAHQDIADDVLWTFMEAVGGDSVSRGAGQKPRKKEDGVTLLAPIH